MGAVERGISERVKAELRVERGVVNLVKRVVGQGSYTRRSANT